MLDLFLMKWFIYFYMNYNKYYRWLFDLALRSQSFNGVEVGNKS